MENQINITVSGKTNTGKSKIIYVIKEFLKVYGLDVEFDASPDFEDDKSFNKHMRTNIDEAMEHISKKSKIVIKEKTVNE